MKAIGVARRIDDLGRVVIPKELRKTLNMENGSPLEFFVDGEDVILRKFQNKCVLCGNQDYEELKEFKGKKICKDCRQNLKEL